jgi:thiamine kinase-like enzyme
MPEPLSQINAEEAEIRAVLARLPALMPGGDWLIEPLTSLTNRNFRLVRGTEAYVLRLPGPGTARYIDRAAEAANAAAAAAIGLAPEVVFLDPADGVMLTRYIEGARSLSSADLGSPDHLPAMVGLLRHLHRSGVQFRGVMRLYPKMDEYLALARASPRQSARMRLAELTALRREAARLQPILGPGWGPARPCHIDPAPHNFIVAGGRHYLLDWEYSAMCEPVWDLAGLSIEGGLDPEGDAHMLEIYFGRAEGQWQNRLHLYKIVLRLLAASWAAVQIADGNSPDAARDLLDAFLPRVEEGLGAPDLGRHIASA